MRGAWLKQVLETAGGVVVVGSAITYVAMYVIGGVATAERAFAKATQNENSIEKISDKVDIIFDRTARMEEQLKFLVREKKKE